MVKTTFQNLWSRRNTVLILAASLVLIINVRATFQEMGTLYHKRQMKPYIFLGDEFKGLQERLRNIPQAGYCTDRSLDNKFAAAKFAQAQYTLAPTLLEFNSISHPYIIFDYADTKQAVENIKRQKLQPVRVSSSGIILTRNSEYH